MIAEEQIQTIEGKCREVLPPATECVVTAREAAQLISEIRRLQGIVETHGQKDPDHKVTEAQFHTVWTAAVGKEGYNKKLFQSVLTDLHDQGKLIAWNGTPHMF